MKISVPRTIRKYEEVQVYRNVDDPKSYYMINVGCPGLTSSVEVPSFFQTMKSGNGNTVVHVKPNSVQVVGSTTNGEYMLNGDYPRYHNNSDNGWHVGSYRARVMSNSHIRTSADIFTEYRPGFTKYTEYIFSVQVLQIVDSDSTYYSSLPVRFTQWTRTRRYYANGRVDSWDSYSPGTALSSIVKELISATLVAMMDMKYLGKRPTWAMVDNMHTIMYDVIDSHQLNISSTKNTTKLTESCRLTLPSKPLEAYLILDEYNQLFNGVSLEPYCAYHLNALKQSAYLDALDHVPQLNDNMVSNVIELVGFIKSLIIDHKIEIPDSLSSLWLSYRYAFKTTELDASEAIEFVHRHVDDEFLRKGFSCYGSATTEYKGVPIMARCRMDLKSKELSILDKVWTALYRYGLSPSFYMIWDMIPYSFILDWFVPIGDILNQYDKTDMYNRTYDITNVWFSLTYDNIDDEASCHVYTRWFSGTLPEFNGYYTLENKGTTSKKVIGMRILDAASLIFS